MRLWKLLMAVGLLLAAILLWINPSSRNTIADRGVLDSARTQSDSIRRSVPHGVVLQLPTSDSVIALTFDGCESITPSYFDTTILNTLLLDRIPFTVFAGGLFAVRNRLLLDSLAKLNFVEIENHSFSHHQHMENLSDSLIERELSETDDSIQAITDMRSQFFRFPGGNYDDRSLRLVEGLGYRVVHWTFESGDPDKKVTPEKLRSWVLEKTRPGAILIFHINGRGYSTGEALPFILKELSGKGYRFVLLRDYL